VIEVKDLNVTVGEFSLENISFELEAGEYGILMGRTGSGKTTLLESLCGLKPITSGHILINGEDVTRCAPGGRGIGFVPQEGALFHGMTVRDQVGFALQIRKQPRTVETDRVESLAERLGISHLLDRRPEGLSGGERQRVALGRALAAWPSVLCLDEPFSALDDETRAEMYELIGSVTRDAGVTAIHITHSQAEADVLGDRLFRMDAGRLASTGNEMDPAPVAGVGVADDQAKNGADDWERDGPDASDVVECDERVAPEEGS